MTNTADFNDWYNDITIVKGDECSRILAETTASTLQNHPDVVFVRSGMNHIAVLKPREDNLYAVFSIGGPVEEKDMQMYVKKMIETGVNTSLDRGLIPLGFADVIDASKSDPEFHKYKKKLGHKLAVLNGEYADLGDRVTVDANMNITMVCCAKNGQAEKICESGASTLVSGITRFNPGKDFIYTNSDGVGTKHILYELAGQEHLSVTDSMAMKLDDLVKINARAIITSDVLEHNGLLSYEKEELFRGLAIRLMSPYGIGMINAHDVGDRLKPYKPGMIACNLSGSAISLISEDKLSNFPKPVAGNYLISIRKAKDSSLELLGPDGWRSNGITLLRTIPKDAFGEDWYLTPEGKEILKFATTPSDIFYPIFKQVLDEGAASSVLHLSGGSYNGKLAGLLAKEGLHVTLTANPLAEEHLWPVSDIVKKVIELSGMPPTSFYNKWVMSNPGFIFTDYPATAMHVAETHGYLSGVVDRLEKSDKPGVSLEAYNGEKIYFDGK